MAWYLLQGPIRFAPRAAARRRTGERGAAARATCRSISTGSHRAGPVHDRHSFAVDGKLIEWRSRRPAREEGRRAGQDRSAPLPGRARPGESRRARTSPARRGREGPHRFKTLALKSFETQQNVDLQQAKVDQSRSIAADDAAIETAQTQLDYTIIRARATAVGVRQVDPAIWCARPTRARSPR